MCACIHSYCLPVARDRGRYTFSGPSAFIVVKGTGRCGRLFRVSTVGRDRPERYGRRNNKQNIINRSGGVSLFYFLPSFFSAFRRKFYSLIGHARSAALKDALVTRVGSKINILIRVELTGRPCTPALGPSPS